MKNFLFRSRHAPKKEVGAAAIQYALLCALVASLALIAAGRLLPVLNSAFCQTIAGVGLSCL